MRKKEQTQNKLKKFKKYVDKYKHIRYNVQVNKNEKFGGKHNVNIYG